MVEIAKKSDLSILLFEDDPMDAFLTKRYLNSSPVPCKIQHFDSSEEGLNFLKKGSSEKGFKKPDIIILDINMPHKNGWEVLQFLKSTPGLTEIPVIILSGDELSQDQVPSELLKEKRILKKWVGMKDFVSLLAAA